MAGSTPTSTERPRVTITQVAELAGVSATTVSHVLSGKRLVAEHTREAVHEAIRTLGYRPNHTARSLRRSEEHTSELQSRQYLVCRLLLEKKNKILFHSTIPTYQVLI